MNSHSIAAVDRIPAPFATSTRSGPTAKQHMIRRSSENSSISYDTPLNTTHHRLQRLQSHEQFRPTCKHNVDRLMWARLLICPNFVGWIVGARRSQRSHVARARSEPVINIQCPKFIVSAEFGPEPWKHLTSGIRERGQSSPQSPDMNTYVDMQRHTHAFAAKPERLP